MARHVLAIERPFTLRKSPFPLSGLMPLPRVNVLVMPLVPKSMKS